jgi:hypothetical protein
MKFRKAIGEWKEVIGDAGHSFLMKRIGVILAEARAAVWRFK